MILIAHIYKIVNKVNNKFYIGSSKQLHKRWKNHISALTRGDHPNPHLQGAWNKYGKESFEFILLEEVSDKDQFKIEQKYLEELKPFGDVGYNILKNPLHHIYNRYARFCIGCGEIIPPEDMYDKFCSDECSFEHEHSSWRKSGYLYKDISDWNVDDHTASAYDDRMEK